MLGRVGHEEDPVCASGPPLDTRWHERLLEIFVRLLRDPLWQHYGRDAAVPAVPAVEGSLSQQEEAPSPE